MTYTGEDLEEKKLLGSGGYVFAKLTEQDELRASFFNFSFLHKSNLFILSSKILMPLNYYFL